MTTSPQPLVSVIIPAFNAERFINSTLQSVLAQSYRSIEVLVIDDGSTDGTAEVVASFAENDRRVSLLRKANGGVASARNLGLTIAKGDYIAPCDSDDVWYDDKLKEQVECLSQSEAGVGLVYCWSRIIDEESKPIVDISHSFEGDVFADLLFSNFLGNGSCALFRRQCFESVGTYNAATTPSEEWDYYLRIAERYKFRVVPKILVGYREVLTSLSANHRRMVRAFETVMNEVSHRHPDTPKALERMSRSFFYFYLTGKSNRKSEYATSIRYLWRSFWSDPMRIVSSEFHMATLKTLIRFMAKPITSRIWRDDRAWREMKQFVTTKSIGAGTVDQSTTHATAPTRLYDRLRNRRMMHLRKKTDEILDAWRTGSSMALKTTLNHIPMKILSLH